MMNAFWNRENIPDSFVADDGLLHCSLCGGPLEVRLPEYNEFFKSDKRPSTCKCREEKIIREREEHARREHIELVDAGLIEKKRMTKGRANMIYVKVPETSIVGKSPVVCTENRPYKGKKTASTWGGKLATNNNNKQETITSYKYGEDTF